MNQDTPAIALVKSLYAAFGKGDIASIVGVMTADSTWESTGRLKKTGKSAASNWVHIFTIADRKVKAFCEFSDTARAAEAYRA